MRRFAFLKGQATRNDFIIIDDQHGMRELTPKFVSRLCDRRSGIGADGVLRVVRAHHVKEWDGDPDLWFMDYWNADGTIAELCGNGLRVFARYLSNEQLVAGGRFNVATRAGAKEVRIRRGGLIATNLGRPKLDPDPVTVELGDQTFEAVGVDVGNPHAVVFVDESTLAALDLHGAPVVSPAGRFPDGVNVEFVAEKAAGSLVLRVHERGVGETMSCGTGVVAAAAAYRQRSGFRDKIKVRVPGGDLRVSFDDDAAWLSGPAVIHMHGEFLG